jgi:protocatechuate 3,4-dioxygenase beta subunit
MPRLNPSQAVLVEVIDLTATEKETHMSKRSPFTVFNRPPAEARRFYDAINKEHYLATSRRSVIKTGAVAVAVSAVGVGAVTRVAAQAVDDSTAESTDATATGVCVLTPEITEGPYYLDDMILREDITEGKAGIPLELRLLILDATACTPIENAAVEIWHTDALGFYSGFTENSPGGTGAYVDDGSDPQTFLRGLQLTDADGYVTFQTIYPGWYVSRDIHIHMKVHVGGEAANGTYEGGHVSHTGQLAFDDAITEQVALIEPYSTKTDTFTRLEEDNVFSDVEEDDPSFFVELTQVDDANMAAGFTGTITLGVDPTAE